MGGINLINEVLNNVSVEEKKAICSLILHAQETTNINYIDHVTAVSKPMYMWDELNKNIGETLDKYGYNHYITQYGNWPFIIFQKNNHFYTFMRSNRFKYIQRKRDGQHYSLRFALLFNKNVENIYDEISLFPEQKVVINDTDGMKNKIESMLEVLVNDEKSIGNHAFILFDVKEDELQYVEVLVLDSKLNVAERENWNNYISVEPSSMVETVDEADIFEPIAGVKLNKESQRIKSAKERKQKKEEAKEEDMK